MRTKIVIKFDKNKDFFNIWETCAKKSRFYDFSGGMPKDLVSFCSGRKFSNSRKYIAKYMKKIHSSKNIKIFVGAIQEAWKSIEKQYFDRLARITGKSLEIKEITGYVTTASRCPYSINGNYFMINFFSSIPENLRIIGHELMHFHFHKYYWKGIERKIGKEKTANLKEALTVLLNLEFKDLWFVQDRGYEINKDLRQFIQNVWRKNKNFDFLLNKCITRLS